jgi:hypothetical protein
VAAFTEKPGAVMMILDDEGITEEGHRTCCIHLRGLSRDEARKRIAKSAREIIEAVLDRNEVAMIDMGLDAEFITEMSERARAEIEAEIAKVVERICDGEDERTLQ